MFTRVSKPVHSRAENGVSQYLRSGFKKHNIFYFQIVNPHKELKDGEI
jgi:hypothetical protein